MVRQTRHVYYIWCDNSLFTKKLNESYTNISTLSNEDYQHSFAATYFHPVTGRLFYSFEDWTGGGSDGDLNDIVFMIEGVDKMHTDKGEIPVKVKDSSDTETKLSWLIAAEDLGTTDDFDFNDVVFSINSITTNSTTVTKEYGDLNKTELLGTITKTVIHKEATINALAAGGTLPVWLHYHDGTKDYILGPNNKVYENTSENASAIEECEWHRWFGKTSSTSMINTGRGPTVSTPYSCNIGHTDSSTSEVTGSVTSTPDPNTVSSEWKIAAFADFSMVKYSQTLTDGSVKGFYITVNGVSGSMQELGGTTTSDQTGKTHVIGAARTGEAPQMFLIQDVGYNGTWNWPEERYHLMECYPGFADWVTESNETTNKWHEQEPQSSVYNRPENKPATAQ